MISSHRKLLAVSPVVAAFALVALGAMMASGCNNSNNGTGPTPVLMTETFTGSIAQGGTDTSHTFTVTSDQTQLLAGFTAIGPSTVTALGIGIAVWDPTSSTCGLNQQQAQAAAVGVTAISATAGAGPYCLRVFDGGNITAAGTTATYTVQVQHY